MNNSLNHLAVCILALGLAAQHAAGQGAQGARITQRAREVVNQNNVRQGVGQPSRPASAPTASQRSTSAPVQTQQQSINAIRAEIVSFLGNEQSSEAKVQKFSAVLLRAARGAKKPSTAAINKLAESIATNLSGQTLGSSEQTRLAEDLEAVLNASKMSQLQADAYVSDVQAVLEVAGVKRSMAVSAADDVKTILTDLRH